ncbi:MAG: leucyl aminopeptidase family protein [Gammaproteobacteria bacterium]|nr:leucyl aminopeptidase family protein [Gammaproteobacteria bacterium]
MIGVSRNRVKPASGQSLLPPTMGFKVVQSPGRTTKTSIGRVDHLIVLVPHRIPASAWREIAGLNSLQAVHKRLGKEGAGRPLRGAVGKHTAVTLGVLPAPRKGTPANAPPAPFELLKFAGELVGDGLKDEPRSIGLVIHGFNAADTERATTAMLLAVGAHAWQMPAFRKKAKGSALKTVIIMGQPKPLDTTRTLAEIEGANLVRWLTALPANKLSASAYRGVLGTLSKQHHWELEWLGEAALKKLNAGAFLAVAQGNAAPEAGIARLRYRPEGHHRGRGHKPVAPDLALIGKGIIFDTGGTNLKSAPHMLDMHTDMSGSAVALAVLLTLTALKAPLNVDCWLAITENRTGSAAYKQRDVITASNGVTIEVMHTDAEGRMVLADTLALAGREKPGLMLDYATLTGACVHALSERYSGVFTNREALNELLVRAGRTSGERVWPFPNDPDFDDDLKSKTADVAQCSSSGEADQILAARFLQRFVPESTPWIHMDLASALRKDGLAQMPGGPTGFGLRYTVSLLLDHADELKQLAG